MGAGDARVKMNAGIYDVSRAELIMDPLRQSDQTMDVRRTEIVFTTTISNEAMKRTELIQADLIHSNGQWKEGKYNNNKKKVRHINIKKNSSFCLATCWACHFQVARDHLAVRLSMWFGRGTWVSDSRSEGEVKIKDTSPMARQPSELSHMDNVSRRNLLFPSPLTSLNTDATQWQMTTVFYWEEEIQRHNPTTMFFICPCVMNKGEISLFFYQRRQGEERNDTFFFFFFAHSSAGAVMPGLL